MTCASDDDARARSVRGLARTSDPGGFELELFHGPILDHEPFASPYQAGATINQLAVDFGVHHGETRAHGTSPCTTTTDSC